jgi:hypothetical protein
MSLNFWSSVTFLFSENQLIASFPFSHLLPFILVFPRLLPIIQNVRVFYISVYNNVSQTVCRGAVVGNSVHLGMQYKPPPHYFAEVTN